MALVLDDLHWADPATLDLLEHLVARRASVALLGTWRLDDPTLSGMRPGSGGSGSATSAGRPRRLALGPAETEPRQPSRSPRLGVTARTPTSSTGSSGAAGAAAVHRAAGRPRRRLRRAARPAGGPPRPAGWPTAGSRTPQLVASRPWRGGPAAGSVGDLAALDRARRPSGSTRPCAELADRYLLAAPHHGRRPAAPAARRGGARQPAAAPRASVTRIARWPELLGGSAVATAAEVAEHWQSRRRAGPEVAWRERSARPPARVAQPARPPRSWLPRAGAVAGRR